MKILFFSLSICLFTLAPLKAQIENVGDGPLKDRIDAMRVAFITEKLGLSPEESEKFWPVFNEHQAKQKSIKRKYKSSKKVIQMSDKELEQHLENGLKQEQELLELKKVLFTDLKEVISVRQIALFVNATQEFNKEVLRKVMQMQQKRRQQRLNGRN